jgi:nucleoside-diphosphate-sugar epimerase
VQALGTDELKPLLAGRDAVVFAAGVDGSHAPRGPAAEFFHQGNVEPVRRLLAAARAAGCGRAVVCGSYFATIARQSPELRLVEGHPYIASRVRQGKVALSAAGPGMSVAVLELPFVFGAAEGRRAALAPMVPWLRSSWPLFAPPGGTAVAPVSAVAQAACGALERESTGSFPIAEENLTWSALFARLAVLAGRPDPVRVRALPPALLRAALLAPALRNWFADREAGLSPLRLTALLTQELYLDPELCRTALGVDPGGLDDSFRDTVAAASEN